METKDFIIYKGIANAAARVFENVICPAGEYTAKDIAKNLLSKYYYKDDFYNNSVQENEIITVEFDGYKCTFPVGSAFDVCAKIETAWQIPSARRVKFIRAAETRPVAVRFDVPAAAKAVINAVAPEKSDAAPAVKFVCVDTRRRAVLGTNGRVLTAVAVADMFVSEDAQKIANIHPNAAGRLCVDPLLMKTRKGTLKIDASGNAANGTQTRPLFNDNVFPSWERVLPAVDETNAVVFGKQFAAVKKAILAAAKFSNTETNAVVLRAVSGCPEIEIVGYRANAEDEKTADQETVKKITLPVPVPVSFLTVINGKDINAVAQADKMFVISEKQPVIFAADNYFSLLMPVVIDKTPYYDSTFSVPGNADILAVCRFPLLDAANTPAALASVQDAPAAAAEDAKETRPSWEQTLPAAAVLFAFDEETAAPAEDAPAVAADSENVLPVDEETASAAFEDAQPVPVSADSWETKYAVAAVESNTRAVDAQAAPVLPAGMDERLYLNICTYLKVFFDEETAYTRAAYNYIILHGVKILFGEIYLHDNKIGSVKKEFANGVCVSAAPVFDVQETAAPVAAEDAPAVQDEETAPAVAVSLPVPCFEETKHAVYIDGVLHGVYFSKLLADAVLFDAFFAGRSVYPLQLTANETAPQTERAAVAVAAADIVPADSVLAVPADSVPAVDEETPQTAKETAPAVQDEETPAADSVPAEDAPAVQNEETPAVLIGCPSRSGNARRFAPWLIRAAAVLAVLLLSVFASWERETPAVAVDIVSAVPVAAEDAPAAPADSVKQFAAVAAEDAPETPAVAAAAPVADKQPQRMKKRPQTAKETAPAVQDAPAVPADSVKLFAAVAVADSVPADSVLAVPADSVPAVDEETPQTAKETAPAVAAEDAPAVQDEETPAVDDSTPQDEETPAADSVPADSVPAAAGAGPGCPAAPAVQCTPAAPVAPVAPIVIACFGI